MNWVLYLGVLITALFCNSEGMNTVLKSRNPYYIFRVVVKADTHWTRFGNAARFFIFQKQINRCTIENFGRYEKYTSLAVEML